MTLTERPAWLPDRVFVVAEAGVNHNGDLNLARQLIDVAAQAGADAVKFQAFSADRLVMPHAPKADYQKGTTSAGETQLEMLRRLELSSDAHGELSAHAANRGIAFLSTPFDEQCADFLDGLGVPIFKVASGEITNLPFLAHMARKGKPMIVSTGMSSLGEIEEAVKTMVDAGNQRLALLHCISNYPADPADVNLRAMQTLGAAFGLPVGFSDHTLGIEVALAAVALGACIIEKHFTLNRDLPGPDHRASLEPMELQSLVSGIRKVEVSLGDGRKVPVAAELNTAELVRKSLVAARDISAGETLIENCIAVRRPGNGLPPSFRVRLLGCRARTAIRAGALLSLDLVS